MKLSYFVFFFKKKNLLSFIFIKYKGLIYLYKITIIKKITSNIVITILH